MIIIVNCSSTNQSEIMKRKFESHVAVLNDHDIEKALSFLSDDFHLHFTDYDFIIDKKGIVNVFGWDKGVNGRVSYKNLVVEGDSITGLFTEQNDFFKLVGIDELKAKITYTFDKSGLIVKQSYTPLPDQPSFQEKMQPAIEWARENRPDEITEIYHQNQMQFNQEMGERWVALLKEWKKATQNEK